MGSQLLSPWVTSVDQVFINSGTKHPLGPWIASTASRHEINAAQLSPASRIGSRIPIISAGARGLSEPLRANIGVSD